MNATPQVLAVLDDLLSSSAPDARGALWRLAEQGRELDANIVRLPPGAGVGEHQEDTLDVLLVVLSGGGDLRTGGGDTLALTRATVTWLPRTSRRALEAGPEGLTYLTVHRRRPGLTIAPAAKASTGYEGGEAPCMLDLVCPECGRLSADRAPRFCSACGEPFPGSRAD
ncbi:zinc ribbon domain-containing protein [Streptomyces sp. NBC_01754]|uniref:zinc ribbon domain-containing protein n=1 Tax=Streptomyces sp. NBC_01754 TaxID=2975930 RepID=UPI002DDAD76E|nr:zinc ribbon domain-containing protein [Streptomyces sp. NBC_01754]WSC94127.1 zinc ribbon domain-containing protein [Streptomyces sp. NBC_01754]